MLLEVSLFVSVSGLLDSDDSEDRRALNHLIDQHISGTLLIICWIFGHLREFSLNELKTAEPQRKCGTQQRQTLLILFGVCFWPKVFTKCQFFLLEVEG